MSKQTAVEWLKKELEEYGSSSHLSLDWETFDELVEQAKAMERKQIEDAYINSETGYHSNDDAKAMAEHYYEQTYGKEASHE